MTGHRRGPAYRPYLVPARARGATLVTGVVAAAALASAGLSELGWPGYWAGLALGTVLTLLALVDR